MLTLIVLVAFIFFLQDFLFARLAPWKLEYTCTFAQPDATEGDTLHLIETVRNRKPVPVLWMMVDIHSSRFLEYGGANAELIKTGRRVSSLFSLRGRQKVTRRWTLTCKRRGLYRIDNVTLIWGGMMGYKSGSAATHCGASLVVYPALLDLDRLFTPASLILGDASVRRLIVDDPFLYTGVREYSPSDPMNRVHWGATARHGTLMVRQNDYTSQVSAAVVLNIQAMEFEASESTNEDMSELAVKVAATLVHRALQSGSQAAFYTNAAPLLDAEDSPTELGFGAGETHWEQCNSILARLACRNRIEFTDYLTSVPLRSCEVLVVTSYLSDRLAQSVDALRAGGCAVTVYLLTGKPDEDISGYGFGLRFLREEVLPYAT